MPLRGVKNKLLPRIFWCIRQGMGMVRFPRLKLSIIKTLFCVFLVSSSALALVKANADMSERLDAAYRLIDQGATEEALALFSAAFEADETSLPALMGMGEIWFTAGDFKQAFKVYDMVVQAHPNQIVAWNRRGISALNLEKYGVALESLSRAVQDQPMNGFFYESLAWAHFCVGDMESAVKEARTSALMYQREGKFSLYPLLISYFGYVTLDDKPRAVTSLNFARRSAREAMWPFPVLEFLEGRLTGNDLLASVSNKQEETEARVYLGMQLKQEGRSEAAKLQLDWVARHGDRGVFEYTLARSINARFHEKKMGSL